VVFGSSSSSRKIEEAEWDARYYESDRTKRDTFCVTQLLGTRSEKISASAGSTADSSGSKNAPRWFMCRFFAEEDALIRDLAESCFMLSQLSFASLGQLNPYPANVENMVNYG
jgi:hypothetical protein